MRLHVYRMCEGLFVVEEIKALHFIVQYVTFLDNKLTIAMLAGYRGSEHKLLAIYKPLWQLILILIYLAFIAGARSRRVFMEWEQ